MKISLTLFTLVLPVLLLAQPTRGEKSKHPRREQIPPDKGMIAGKVLDEETGLSVEFANISVFKSGTTTLVSGTNSSANGQFSIQNLDFGTYDLKVNFIGYKSFSKDKIELRKDHQISRLGNIFLGEQSSNLSEIEVTGKREMIQFGLDKKIFNVEKDLTAISGDATEVLKNIPSVEVDIDGNVSLRGNMSVKIFINGRPSGLVGLDRRSVLQQIPANVIQNIEVMTNPSAKYSPEGIAGIINIITKKQNKGGFNLGTTLSYDTNNSIQTAVNFNYRLSKLNFFTNYALRHARRYRKGTTEQQTIKSDTSFSVNSNMNLTGYRSSQTFSGGVEYYFNARSIISAGISYAPNTGNMNGVNNFENFNDKNIFTGYSARTDSDRTKGSGKEHTLSFSKNFKQKDQILNITASYSDSNRDELESFDESFFEPGGNLIPKRQLIQNTPNLDKNSLLLFQGDYGQNINENIKFETGYRFTVQNQDNDYARNEYDFGTAGYFQNDTFTNFFHYDEDIFALYALMSGSLKKVEYSLGLRGEQANTGSDLKDIRFSGIENMPVENNYFELYPSAGLSYSLSETSKIQVNYSRRVNRPRIRQLIPAIDISSRYASRVGNPYLRPEFIDSYEVSYLKSKAKGTFNISLFFRDKHDAIARYTRDDGLIILSSYANLDSERDYGVEIVSSYRPLTWWNMNLSLTGYWQEADASSIEEGLTAEGFNWNGRLISNFTVWKDMNIQSFVFYRAKSVTTQGNRFPFAWADLAFRKPIFNKKCSVTLKFSDLFNTRRYKYELDTPKIKMTRTFNWPSQAISLALSYQLGESKRKKGQKNGRDFSGDEDF